MKNLFIVLTITVSFFFQFLAQSQDTQEREVVAKILNISTPMTRKIPPDLMLTVVGEVPTAGYSQVKLSRVNYAIPPKDSIQDYILYAVPPVGIVPQIISEVKASDVYYNLPPWIKGIRVHGVGDGIKYADFSSEKAFITENHGREFIGESRDGSIDNALVDAFKKLDKALGEGGVYDAKVTWELKEISGAYGGVIEYNEVRVIIETWRTPEWSGQ